MTTSSLAVQQASLEFRLAARQIAADFVAGFQKVACLKRAARSLVSQGWSQRHAEAVAARAWDDLGLDDEVLAW